MSAWLIVKSQTGETNGQTIFLQTQFQSLGSTAIVLCFKGLLGVGSKVVEAGWIFVGTLRTTRSCARSVP